MNTNNLYGVLSIPYSASYSDVLDAYKMKILKYFNKESLNENEINEIKMLKKALYILTNTELRLKYNNILNNNQQTQQQQEEEQQQQPMTAPIPFSGNSNDDDLDSLFKVDNKWMNNIETKDKKNKDELNISDRVFSLSEYNRPTFSSEFERSLKNPYQRNRHND
jgi:DnaJ-class molecular chaperone